MNRRKVDAATQEEIEIIPHLWLGQETRHNNRLQPCHSSMTDLADTVARLAREDRRYTADAYYFVFEALNYAQRALGMGTPKRGDRRPREEADRHLTGQQLCEAIRQFALEQYGYMAKCVLNSWGVKCTGDFGEIVFNLIRVEQMRKTPQDKREDFEDNFDFEEAFVAGYRITLPE